MIFINDSKHKWYLLPISILCLSLVFAKVNSFIIVMLVFGYLWSWGLYSENVYKKVHENFRYRFSFLKLYSIYGSVVYHKIKINSEWCSIVLKSIINGVIVLPHFALTQNAQVFTFIVGTLSFETLRLMTTKSK